MNKENFYYDDALRIVMQKKAETSENLRITNDFSDRLMERIMGEIVAQKHRPQIVWLNIVSTAMTVAAVLFIAFFITLHLPSSKKTEQNITYYNIANLPKSSTLEQVYTSRLEQKKSNQLSYTHFKHIIYEK